MPESYQFALQQVLIQNKRTKNKKVTKKIKKIAENFIFLSFAP